MLTEFAFTPSIFDEEAHEDKEAWRDQLKELGRNMFPRVSAWPVVVSDLYAGSWNQIVDQTVKRIKDHKARVLCEGILQHIQRALVPRPVCGDWPDEDVAWGREAVASNKLASIERIVCNTSTKTTLLEEYDMIRSLDEVEDGGFWRDITSDAHPKMIVADQINLLRKLCLHSQWVALINPYTSTNETDFALELLRMALNRPIGFGAVKVELHTQEPQGCTDKADLQARLRSVTSNVSRLVRNTLSASDVVDLYFWPKILERRLIAGTFATDSKGQEHKSPRWGVSMNHVARGTEPDTDPTNWSLLRKEELDIWFRRYVKEDAPNQPTPTSITLVTRP